jgi:6-phospho-beta-glucosidase
MTRICVLGGSSPYTVALVEALAENGPLRPVLGTWTLVLQGRNAQNLEAVAEFARHRLRELGTAVVATVDIDTALGCADVVIVQTRFGGLEARAQDEHFARGLGCHVDETLGPCGLLSAFRQMPLVDELAVRMSAMCPNAFVLNMMNPLSLTTAMIIRRGVNAVGVCELPLATFLGFADALGMDPGELTWSYEGFNHRGFVVDVATRDGLDVFRRVAASAGDGAIGKYRGHIIALGAVPTKYFGLFDDAPPQFVGRAAALRSLRDHLLSDLIEDPTRAPSRIKERDMPWYSQAVVPLLAARVGMHTYDATLNIVSDGGLVREKRVRARTDRIDLLQQAPGDGTYQAWLSAFERHERLSLAALANPNRQTIESALAVDRITPPEKLETAASYILQTWENAARGMGARANSN